MKKTLCHFLLFILLVSNASLKAQDTTISKNESEANAVQFRLRIGQASPRNSFGDRLGVNQDAALAKNGLNIGVGAFIPIYKNIDFAVDLSSSSYETESSALLAGIQALAPDFTWSLNLGEYDVRNAMAGPKFYIGDKFRAYVNPMFGFSWIRYPNIRFDGERVEDDKSITTAYSVQDTELSRDFAIAMHTGFDYYISEQLALNFNLEWMSYEAETSAIVDFLSVEGERGVLKEDIALEYQTLNIGVGIVFKLNR